MTKLLIEDDCLAPDTPIKIHYKGPNPFRAYSKTITFLRKIWEIEAKDYWERQFRYNPDEDPRGFYVTAYVNKGLDRFTRIIVEVVMQGAQPSDPTKEGWIEIKIGGVLKTEYGGNTIFEDIRNPITRFLYWLYDKVYYQDRRKYYLKEWCYKRLHELKERYQELLGILPPEKFERKKRLGV